MKFYNFWNNFCQIKIFSFLWLLFTIFKMNHINTSALLFVLRILQLGKAFHLRKLNNFSKNTKENFQSSEILPFLILMTDKYGVFCYSQRLPSRLDFFPIEYGTLYTLAGKIISSSNISRGTSKKKISFQLTSRVFFLIQSQKPL